MDALLRQPTAICKGFLNDALARHDMPQSGVSDLWAIIRAGFARRLAMKLLIAYATTQGQTRKIARHIADMLFDMGHSVELLSATDAPGFDPGRYDAAVLAASVHAGHYQKGFVGFVAGHAEGLNALPCAFVSVSLAAAGHIAEDWRALDEIAEDFCKATRWMPGQTLHVAGAYKPSDYDIVTRMVMRRILATKDPEADPKVDREYTDWPALDREITGWAAQSLSK
jgi:menaquinone-dependent protoporphyrinogen oxidase